jgi:death-on-curing protein
MKRLSAKSVLFIHEQVINPHELQGLARNKSLDAVMARVENRIQYAMIADSYDLAACYAVVIAMGHVFNDANKRTAFRTMSGCLRINGLDVEFDTESIGQMIIKAAQGLVDEVEFARYLRVL